MTRIGYSRAVAKSEAEAEFREFIVTVLKVRRQVTSALLSSEALSTEKELARSC